MWGRSEKTTSLHPSFARIVDVKYVDATTGRIVEEMKMREFYEWDEKSANGPAYVMVRHYQLSLELKLNPSGEGL